MFVTKCSLCHLFKVPSDRLSQSVTLSSAGRVLRSCSVLCMDIPGGSSVARCDKWHLSAWFHAAALHPNQHRDKTRSLLTQGGIMIAPYGHWRAPLTAHELMTCCRCLVAEDSGRRDLDGIVTMAGSGGIGKMSLTLALQPGRENYWPRPRQKEMSKTATYLNIFLLFSLFQSKTI